ncbi:class I SAM-dependent methyltransferase [Acinetobacter faecalis]|uniref:class I SAM-dependent methyltransferase n=1 Tax=Acinetobacter faecalis TaxID=2665161 RepID=UPI002A917131|nr:class I SAM-dependent methyltransferase [Acinetobacter faecalis]MDY6467673.1 class I SAM-dependent methyltransferase [Acinetobacter faecalis]
MAKDFESQHVVNSYDQHIRQLIPGYDLAHHHIKALLKSHIKNKYAQVLVIGCGTGYELSYLLQLFPKWTFVVTELSETMLSQAKQNVQQLNEDERVEFVVGDFASSSFADQYSEINFDAVLTILVSHFIEYETKPNFFRNIYNALKQNGIFLTFDLMKFETENESEILKDICMQNGLSEKQASTMLSRLNDDFYPLSENETLGLLEKIGFHKTQRFIQVASYKGFIVFK